MDKYSLLIHYVLGRVGGVCGGHRKLLNLAKMFKELIDSGESCVKVTINRVEVY